MAPKVFNNVIIGQFVLSGAPIKVYTSGRFLTITDADDVEDPTIGFGMDENGDMIQFAYPAVEFLSVQGNKVDIETYNKGMEKLHGGDEAPADKEPEKEEPADEEGEEKKDAPSMSDHYDPRRTSMKLKNILKESFLGELPSERNIIKMKHNPLAEASQEEVDADIEGAEAAIDAAKAKAKAAQAALKNTVKKSKEKIKAAKAQPIEEDRDYSGMSHGILAVAAKADGEGMAQIAGMLGVDVGEYDLEDDGDLDDLYDDIETALGQVSTAEVEQLYNELRKLNLVEGHEGGYTFGTGDIVGNKNPGCVHYGSKGIVIQIPSKGMVRYSVTNTGDTFKPGDILTKTADQMEKI